MIVVADTSPLNYLIQLGRAEILMHIYGRVFLPSAVLVEMQHADAPPEVRVWSANPPMWIEQVKLSRMDPWLPDELGIGEREAISLAMELGADVLLIDDLAGRQAARSRHISVAGTLAVLLQASLRGYVSFPAELERLRLVHFRMSPDVVAEMLARYHKAQL